VEEAWQVIHDDLIANPAAVAIIRELDRDPHSQEALSWSRRQWAAWGLPPPWEDRL
jgi:hypothetical protein